jgi:hypothetical protein
MSLLPASTTVRLDAQHRRGRQSCRSGALPIGKREHYGQDISLGRHAARGLGRKLQQAPGAARRGW